MNKYSKLWTVLPAALMVALIGCRRSDYSAHDEVSRPRPQRVVVQRPDRTPRQETAGFRKEAPRTCPTCGGTGYVICYTCNGSGRVKCDGCRGTGTDATGRRCIMCGGSGTHGCTTCGIITGTSKGRLQCQRCKGRGTVTP